MSHPDSKYKQGDQVLYTRANATPVAAVVLNVHVDDATPYYTVSITSTGREVNTDAGHLQHGAQVRQNDCCASPTRNIRRVAETIVSNA